LSCSLLNTPLIVNPPPPSLLPFLATAAAAAAAAAPEVEEEDARSERAKRESPTRSQAERLGS